MFSMFKVWWWYFFHLEPWWREKFLEKLSGFDQYIKFPYGYSVENIPFLDFEGKLKDGKIATYLHWKPTDHYQYLHFSPAHPNQTKGSAVFSQTLNISRLWSNESDFELKKDQKISCFLNRKYYEKLTDTEIRKVEFKIRETNRKNKSKNG